MWWPCDELVEGGCVDEINGDDDDDESASVLVPFAIVIVIRFFVVPIV